MEERPRAADDYAAIRARMEELKREREAEEKRAKRAAVEEEKLRRISEELRSRVFRVGGRFNGHLASVSPPSAGANVMSGAGSI